jgi:hypothetical protein
VAISSVAFQVRNTSQDWVQLALVFGAKQALYAVSMLNIQMAYETAGINLCAVQHSCHNQRQLDLLLLLLSYSTALLTDSGILLQLNTANDKRMLVKSAGGMIRAAHPFC